MPKLLSGSTLRRGGSGEFIDLPGAMPQLPESPTTSTGYTLVTDSLLRTRYRSSLGNLEFHLGKVYSNLPDGMIKLTGTGTGYVHVTKDTVSVSTDTGALVVSGGIGVGGTIWTKEDIHVNGLTIGQGFQGINNIVVRGTATPQVDDYNSGQESIVIGYDALTGLDTSYKDIAIGRYALGSGKEVSNSIAIGDSALKNVGASPTMVVSTISNVQFNIEIPILNITNASTATITANSHGLNTGDRIYILGVDGLIDVGTGNSGINGKIFYIDKIDVDSFNVYYNKALITSFDSSALTPYIGSGTAYTPMILTVDGFDQSSGTRVLINDVEGTIELNGRTVYVDVLTTQTLALYKNVILTVPLTSTNFTSYISSGTVSRYIDNDKNIAIGVNAGINLLEGQNNLFLGNEIAENIKTGSYNIFIGHEVSNNVIKGTANISIGGDNLVDGRNNQVNIGSVLYYDGKGYLQLNSDTEVGLGTMADESLFVGNISNISQTIPAVVTLNGHSLTSGDRIKIIDVLGMVEANNQTYFIKVINDNSFSLHSNKDFNNPAYYIDGTVYHPYTGGGQVILMQLIGALVVSGGAAISENLLIKGPINVFGTGTSQIAGNLTISGELDATGSVVIYPSITGSIDNVDIGINSAGNAIFNDLTINNIATGTITTSTNLQGGELGSIPYQTAPGVTDFIPIGNTNTVLISNGSTATWDTIDSLTAGKSQFANEIFVNTSTSTLYYIGLTEVIGTYSNYYNDIGLSYDGATGLVTAPSLSITSTATSTSTTTSQALEVTGGIGVGGNVFVNGGVYSKDGQADEGYLLYTPRVFVTNIEPVDKRVGDFWIDTDTSLEYQYINDNGNRVWIQLASL